MSYSVCFNCEQMVPRYEKYCSECAAQFRQDDTFWKDEPDAYALSNHPALKERELRKDFLPLKKAPK